MRTLIMAALVLVPAMTVSPLAMAGPGGGRTGHGAQHWTGPPAKPKDLAATGWIIQGSQLPPLITADQSLVTKYMDRPSTVVLAGGSANPNQVPAGWSAQAGEHFTSNTTTGCTGQCYGISPSLQGVLSQNNVTTGLYDDENWSRTPSGQQTAPCPAMARFNSTAKSIGLTSIAAPDQNLAAPGVGIPGYQGGESQNWQSYLRLGLAGCAAASGAARYHVMSQPYEAHWCGNPEGNCQGSESDFVNFVTQAALQARAVDPNLMISDGLSTNTRYFNDPGDPAVAVGMYQDSADVADVVDGTWMNAVGTNATSDTVGLLQKIDGQAPVTVHKSVLFAKPPGTMGITQPTGSTASNLDLSTVGTTYRSIGSATLPAGTTIPAGAYQFQFWTGPGTGTATLSLGLGYCADAACTNRVPIVADGQSSWRPVVGPNAQGAAVAGGALTTTAAITLPPGGPYHLYWDIQVSAPGNFSLRYGSAGDATNLATPILFDATTGGQRRHPHAPGSRLAG